MINGLLSMMLMAVAGLPGMFTLQSASSAADSLFVNSDIRLIHLKDSVYVHETWHHLDEFGRFPSNGLIIVKNGKSVMIDTPFDNEKTQILAEFCRDSLHAPVTRLIAGHFHDDCIGGLEYLQGIGVRCIANTRTIEKCIQLGLPVPDISFTDSLVLDFNGMLLDCRYFGGGHSFDNIIVWLPDQQILFGGCLIRSLRANSLGNLVDAVPDEWDVTVERIIQSYPEVRIVVPGHGAFGGFELLNHTIERVRIYRANANIY